MLGKIANYLKCPWTDPDRKESAHGDSLFPLDGLRGLAAIIVIASHTGAFGMSGQGSLGVFLFFTLSGFVLMLPYVDRSAAMLRPGEVARFFYNRALRIIPVFVVAVLCIRWQRAETWQWVLANISFHSGWTHLWSVAEEARFYALFPLVVAGLAFLKSQQSRMAALSVLVLIAWKFQTIHLVDMMTGGFAYFFFWFFMAGMLCATIYRALQRRAPRWVIIALGCGAFFVLPALFASSDSVAAALWRPLLPWLPESLNGWHQPEIWCGLFAVLLLGVSLSKDSWASGMMKSKVMRHLGLLSYSLYLFHVPVMIEFQRYGLETTNLFFATLAGSYIVALVTYLAIEKPFLMLKTKARGSIDRPVDSDHFFSKTKQKAAL